MGLITIGLPFGMIVGLLVGLKLDRKAHAGNQLTRNQILNVDKAISRNKSM